MPAEILIFLVGATVNAAWADNFQEALLRGIAGGAAAIILLVVAILLWKSFGAPYRVFVLQMQALNKCAAQLKQAKKELRANVYPRLRFDIQRVNRATHEDKFSFAPVVVVQNYGHMPSSLGYWKAWIKTESGDVFKLQHIHANRFAFNAIDGSVQVVTDDQSLYVRTFNDPIPVGATISGYLFFQSDIPYQAIQLGSFKIVITCRDVAQRLHKMEWTPVFARSPHGMQPFMTGLDKQEKTEGNTGE